VTQWLSFSDYFFLQLFGVATTSVSMASATGLFNQENCDWDKELTAGLGLLWQQLPEISQPGQTLRLSFVNYVTRWPLLEGAAWYPAIGDGAATNIGAGCVTPDRAVLTIGASGGMRVLFSGTAPQTLPAELFCYRADRDRVVIGGYLTDGSDLIARTRDALKPDAENDESKQQLGSVTEATCNEFARLAHDIDKLAPNADIVAVRDSSVSSPMLLQKLADGLGRPIEASPVDAPSLRGAGLLALEAIGKIDSIETIDTPGGEIYEPGMSSHTDLKIET
jgi:gluconokinase